MVLGLGDEIIQINRMYFVYYSLLQLPVKHSDDLKCPVNVTFAIMLTSNKICIRYDMKV